MLPKDKVTIPLGTQAENTLPSFVELAIESVVGDQCSRAVPGEVGVARSVQIGQVITHRATSNVPILAVRWTIFGNTLKAYPMSTSAGAPIPLDEQDLKTNPISFAWIEPGFYLVGVEITTAQGSAYFSQTFNVFAPKVHSYVAETGAAAVFTETDGRTFLGFRSPPANTGAGIRFTADVEAGADISGYLAFIQLACDERAFVDFDNQSWVNKINGEWVVDNGANPISFLYGGQSWALVPNQRVNVATRDSPAMQLGQPIRSMNIGATPLPVERYEMTLCFFPVGNGNIWVPLTKIAWYWGGSSTFEQGQYQPAQYTSGGAHASEPVGALPRWTKNVRDGGYDPVRTQGRPQARSETIPVTAVAP